MKILLLLNTLFETIFGLIFIFNPGLIPLFAQADALTLYTAKMYGFAALTVALLGLLVFVKFHEQEVLLTGLFLLAFFHIGLTIAQLSHSLNSTETLPAAIAHGIFALGFSVSYLLER